jgi:hypothetical protein
MITVRIENTVRDYDTWRANFDRFDGFRAENGVRAYRVGRAIAAPDQVFVDLQFADRPTAEAFLPKLEQVLNSPQAQKQIIRRGEVCMFATTEHEPVTAR